MDLVLHIGAHRTGSTMVERAITATIAERPDCGTALWAPRRLRDMEGFQATTRRLDDEAEPVNLAAALAVDDLASRIAGEVRAERDRGTERLILSEENFMGGMRNNFRTGVFYPDVARRLAAFDSLLPTSPRYIALAIRDYGAVLTSAYHYLPQAGQEAPATERMRDGILNDRRGWPEIVTEVSKVWPDSELLVWRQEDLSDNILHICGAVAGLEASSIVVPEGKINALKDAAARAPLFSEEEHKQLTHRYNRHVRRIQENDSVCWIGGGQ